MITKLLELARWVRDAQKHGQELGLTDEETAFYDGLAENGSAKEGLCTKNRCWRVARLVTRVAWRSGGLSATAINWPQ